MKTPQRSSVAIPAARLVEDGLPLGVVAAVVGGEEEDVRHVSALCLIQQHGDTCAGEPKWLTGDLSSRYPQSV